MHQSEMVWNERTIEWFERAAVQTNFYQEIVKHCTSLLNPQMSVVDVTCGAGFLSMALAPHVASVHSLDKSREAIQFLAHKAHQLQVENISYEVRDWTVWNPGQPADLLFISDCTSLMTHLEKLKEITKRYIVAVLPEWKKEDRFFLGNVPISRHKGHMSLPKAILYLRSLGIPFQLFRFSCEYGQPFANLDEFAEFITVNYDIPPCTISWDKAHYLLQKRRDGYYLPERRECGIIVIDREQI